MKEKIIKAICLIYYVAMGLLGVAAWCYIATHWFPKIDYGYWNVVSLLLNN